MQEYKINDPGCAFPYRDAENNEWLGISINGCRLESCDRIWIRCWRPRRGGYPSPQPPANLAEETTLWLPHCPERILRPEPGTDQELGNDSGTVHFGLDVRGIRPSHKDLRVIRVVLIPCSTLEATVPGFEEGFTL